MKTKKCTGKYGCGKKLPLTAFKTHFNKKYKKAYYYTQCNKCNNKKQRILRNGSDICIGSTFRTPVISRVCRTCNQRLSIINFRLTRTYTYKNGFSFRRHFYHCKTCYDKKRNKIRITTLHNVYIRFTLIHNLKIDKKNITPEIIELKRAQLKLHRTIKTKQHDKTR